MSSYLGILMTDIPPEAVYRWALVIVLALNATMSGINVIGGVIFFQAYTLIFLPARRPIRSPWRHSAGGHCGAFAPAC